MCCVGVCVCVRVCVCECQREVRKWTTQHASGVIKTLCLRTALWAVLSQLFRKWCSVGYTLDEETNLCYLYDSAHWRKHCQLMRIAGCWSTRDRVTASDDQLLTGT